MNRNTQKWVKVATLPKYSLYRSGVDVNLYQVRLKGSGNYLRRRLTAPSLGVALELAPEVAGLGKRTDGTQPIALADAFAMALAATNRRERSRRDWLKAAEKFLVWLGKKHPLCTEWGLLTRQMIREYLGTYEGKSANYRRLALQPVLQTAGFMHREYGFRNIGERLGIGSKLKTVPKSVYVEDVVALAAYARENRPHLEVGVCLQGLAGLQMLEALRLTWDKVDLERGLIEISGEVKNEYRNRVIPVAGLVVEALERARTRALAHRSRVLDLREKVLVGVAGGSYKDHCSYGRQMKALFRAWNPQCDWAPKDLRNCLPTFSKMEGIHGTIWEQYIGHAPRTITDRHYVPRLTARTPGEEKALHRQMELFRRLVVQPLEEAMQKESVLQLFATDAV